MQLGSKSRFLNEPVTTVQWLPRIAVIQHPLRIKDHAMSKLHSQQQKLMNADPSQALVPLCSTTRFPECATFSESSLVLLLAKTLVNELLRVLAVGNGQSEILKVFQLLLSILPSVLLFPSFLFRKISSFYNSRFLIIVFLVLIRILHVAVKWIAHYREVPCSYLSPETGSPRHRVFVAPFR